jgi:pimeloyl-ACP methyl ester carboxylesterase
VTIEFSKKTGVYRSFDKTPIYYEIRGDGEPIVFVYGIGCLINHWHHQIEYFSNDRFQSIGFDLRGHHKSNPVTHLKHLSMNDLARDVIGLIKHIGHDKVHLIGHSFGTPLLLEIYREEPSVVKSMCFINGFARNPIKGMFGLDVIEPFYYFIRSQYELNPDLWNTIWRLAIDNPITMHLAALAGGFNLHLTHFKDIEIYTRGVARMDLNIFLRLFEEMMNFDGTDVLETIKVPTLVIAGEGDNVTPLKFQEEFRNMIPKAEYQLVPYGTHCTQLDFPELVNLRIEKFISNQLS